MSRDREKPTSSRSSHRERDHQSSKKDKKDSKKSKKDKKDKRHHRHGDDGDNSDVDRELPRGVAKISDDDYFLKAIEFRVWLKQRKNKYVEELSSDESMRLFSTKFVKRWNSGRLDRMYYDGIPERVLESTKRTRHAWGFVKNLNDKERMDLATAKDSVGVSTRKADLLVPDAPARPTSKYGTDLGAPSASDDRKRGRGLDQAQKEDEEDEQRNRRRVEDKRARRHHETVLDELAPRETGREALLEKRRQVGDKLHGAARDRDANRDGLDLDDEFLMGGGRGNDELQKRLSHRADARQRRGDELRERAAAAEAKEAARMDKFLQDMGLAPNGSGDRRPITIQPRRDT